MSLNSSGFYSMNSVNFKEYYSSADSNFVNMSSMYLPPDYLQPLPTTLDAKNSPLALLAQTCSSIGKDPPSKPIIPPLDKKEHNNNSNNNNSGSDKPHSVDSNKTSPLKTRETGRVSTDRPRPVSNESKDMPYFKPLSTSSPKLAVPSPKGYNLPEDRKPAEKMSSPTSVITRPVSNSVSKSSSERTSPVRLKSYDNPKEYRDSPPLKRARSISPAPSPPRGYDVRREVDSAYESKFLHSMYAGLPGGPLSYPHMPYGPGLMSQADALAASGLSYAAQGQSAYLASAHASALAAHQAALKSGNSALAQYLQYARMRTPSMPVCRDPYCTNCLAAQNSHLPSQCNTPGCTQCSHEKSPIQGLCLPGLSSNPSLPTPYSSANGIPSGAVGLSSLHSLYAHNLMTQGQGHPHVCNWMAGSEYCGKRFSTSEELLQHLRTHTSGSEIPATYPYGPLGLSIPSAADIAGLYGQLAGSTGSLSPTSIRRMYPSSLSPLNNSALHASRYHPYKSGLPSVPSGIPPPQSLQSIPPYYSPYSIYGQRIGAAAVP